MLKYTFGDDTATSNIVALICHQDSKYGNCVILTYNSTSVTNNLVHQLYLNHCINDVLLHSIPVLLSRDNAITISTILFAFFVLD